MVFRGMGYVISIANGTTLRTAKASERSPPPLDRLTSSKRASRLGGGHRQEYGETCLTARQASEAFLGGPTFWSGRNLAAVGKKPVTRAMLIGDLSLECFFFYFRLGRGDGGCFRNGVAAADTRRSAREIMQPRHCCSLLSA